MDPDEIKLVKVSNAVWKRLCEIKLRDGHKRIGDVVKWLLEKVGEESS